MNSEIYWIKDFNQARLGTMARPRGGEWLEDEVLGWKRSGVSVVASALTNSEMSELDIIDEPKLCKAQGIELVRFPVPDRGVPDSLIEWTALIAQLSAYLVDQKTVVAHCRMGIGRASMIAMSVMVALGLELEEALTLIIKERGRPIPDTAEQLEWLVGFASAFGKKI